MTLSFRYGTKVIIQVFSYWTLSGNYFFHTNADSLHKIHNYYEYVDTTIQLKDEHRM